MITVIAIVTDGLVYAAWLFVVAIGLTLIFGVMKILNVAHGAFYAFGAYVAATAIGLYFDRGWPVVGGYLAIAVAAIATGLLMGYILERVFLRRVYGKDEVVVVLITYALFLILEDVLILIWGTDGRSAYQPYTEAGSFTVGGLPLSVYDIGLVGFAGLLAIAASYAIKKTTFGRLLTAVIYDRETAAAFGVDVSRVYTVTFLVGAVLGALGGALTAPKISVTPGPRGRGHRAGLRGGGDRRNGLDGGRGGRRPDRRIVPRRRRASDTATRIVLDLRGDGAGSRVPPAGPVQSRPTEKNLT